MLPDYLGWDFTWLTAAETKTVIGSVCCGEWGHTSASAGHTLSLQHSTCLPVPSHALALTNLTPALWLLLCQCLHPVYSSPRLTFATGGQDLGCNCAASWAFFSAASIEPEMSCRRRHLSHCGLLWFGVDLSCAASLRCAAPVAGWICLLFHWT